MRRRSMNLFLAGVAMLLSALVNAGYDEDLAALQQSWAKARYEMKGDEQQKALEQLIAEVDRFAQKNPDQADGYIWAGVVRGSLAESVNGLSALGIVKEGKANLEKALSIDPKAEDGYAYGVLGLMYSRVPSIIAFGDKKKAKELLLKGVETSPDGMNTNYFLAQFLFEQGDYKQALPYAEHAAQATPPRPPEQSLAVSHRQREIGELIEKIKAKQK